MVHLNNEEEAYYLQEVMKVAIIRDGYVQCPRLFGVPAIQVPQSAMPTASYVCPSERAIYVEANGRVTIQPYFLLTFVKGKDGCFHVTLNETWTLKTSGCKMCWKEFALYLEFALTHGRVVYLPARRMLIVKQCLGIPEQLIY